jgi:hypothetical protein
LTSGYHPTAVDVWNTTLKPASPPTSTQTTNSDREPLRIQSYQNFVAGLSPRVKADSKTHNRQTSIVHGIQHSRNGSLASSSSGPLSPQMIAAVGAGSNVSNMGDSTYMTAMSNMSSNTSFSSSTTLVPDRPSTEQNNHTLTQRRVERGSSGRSRRGHGHHNSHSRHKEDVKTVGEYALHVLFTSVSSLNCT